MPSLRSNKFRYFLYNDFNPLIVNLVMDAIKGKYNFKNFTPNWVSREQFERERERVMATLNTSGLSVTMEKRISMEKTLKSGNTKHMTL